MTKKEKRKTMTLEQLQNKRDSCEMVIRKATAEKEEIEKQIDSLVLNQTKKTLTKYKISIVELLKLSNASENEIKDFLHQLRKEKKETKDVSEERKTENHI